MKRVLVFLFTSALLISCSSHSDEGLDGNGLDKSRTYPVSFRVSSLTIKVEPMTPDTKNLPASNFLQYVIYGEDGLVKTESGTNLSNPKVTDYVLKEDLPAGQYYLAVLLGSGPFGGISGKSFTYEASNLNTDYCQGNSLEGLYHNVGMYFKLLHFVVSADASNLEKEIVLEPMWSMVNISVVDIDKSVFPDNVEEVSLAFYPTTCGFRIKDQKGLGLMPSDLNDFPVPSFGISYPLALFKEKAGFKNIPVGQSDNSILEVSFRASTGISISDKILYKGAWEFGKNIIFEAKLKDLTNIEDSNTSFDLILGNLEDEIITID